jgi:hypothetical protein
MKREIKKLEDGKWEVVESQAAQITTADIVGFRGRLLEQKRNMATQIEDLSVQIADLNKHLGFPENDESNHLPEDVKV